jgi:hypothetical protein
VIQPRTFSILLLLVCMGALLVAPAPVRASEMQRTSADNPAPPAAPVRLVFIHHSTGGNWLADGLGSALKDNNYYVSATNYGWGPGGIGDRTDIPNWPEWFTGANSASIMAALYAENAQNLGGYGSWPRLSPAPAGENKIIMFKSCFPNSNLNGNPDDAALEQPDGSYSVANAKAVYNDILTYFAARQDKLFVVITAPPLRSVDTNPAQAANARAFNNWLVDKQNGWLKNYAHANVAVFDLYNVLTSNGGNANTSDASATTGNHHRWYNAAVQHLQTLNSNTLAYPSGDSHPSTAGNQKAAAEFVTLLNVFYQRWQAAPVMDQFVYFPAVRR